MIAGHTEPGFEPIARELERQLQKRGGGAAVCAYWQGRPVVDVWGGARDESGATWERDTPCVSYSTTKGVISTAVHLLADRGLIDYDAPVATYWPEFAAAGKASITVREVMCHRSGLFNVRDLIEDARCLLDWDCMVNALAGAEPARLPAGATAYQALTYGHVVGEIIRRVSGMNVSEFVRTELAEPIGAEHLHIGAPASALGRTARLIGSPARRSQGEREAVTSGRARRRRDAMFRNIERVLRRFGHPIDLSRAASAVAPRGISTLDFSADETLRACIPSANGLLDARSLARMYAFLANGGELDGVRLLSHSTLDRATQVQSHGWDQITILKMYWRLGYHRVSTLRGMPRRAFGHFGWGGSGGWADPTRNASLGFVCNTGSGSPIGDFRILRLSTMLLQCIRRRYRLAKISNP